MPAGRGHSTGSLMRRVLRASLPVGLLMAFHRPSHLVDNCLLSYLRGDLGSELENLVCESVQLLSRRCSSSP